MIHQQRKHKENDTNFNGKFTFGIFKQYNPYKKYLANKKNNFLQHTPPN